MSTRIDVRGCKYCAFCKYWWDPTFRFIEPYMGSQWYYESTGRCKCIKKGVEMSASQTCNNFRCKVDW